jgi:hypothetical protein
MTERFQDDVPDIRTADLIGQSRPMPGWLADRLLRPGEKVLWVRGPWFQPAWERVATHPGLFFLALGLGIVGGGIGVLLDRERVGIAEASVIVAVALVLATILVLGVACGYFTRLVVTNSRLLIAQGYEVVRAWNTDDLPPSMIRYGGGKGRGPSIDLNAVQTLLGGSSDKFTDAKTILSFGKQLDRIQKKRE